MSVLLLSADQKQAIPIIQSLGERGIAVSCLSPNPKAPAFYSKYCTEKIHFEATSDKEAYMDFLKRLVQNRKYKMLITCSDYSTVLVSEHREDLLPHIKLFLPSHDIIKIVTNKSSLMKFAAGHRISVPKTFFPKNLDDLENVNIHASKPLVVKGNTTAGARHVRYARTKAELIRYFKLLHQEGVPPLVQEYIKGKEKLVYALCDKGEVVAYFMMESKRAYPPNGGTPALAYSVFDSQLKDFAFNIIRTTNWSGMAGLDIKQDHKSKNYYLLDFNPRFGATSMLALRSGVDFGYLLYKLVVEGKKEFSLVYTKKTYRSLFREDVLYAAKKPLSIPKWLIDFFNPRIHYGYNWTDPKPYIRMAMNTLGELKNFLLSGSR